MTHIKQYLQGGTLLSNKKKSRRIQLKFPQYKILEGTLYRRSYLHPLLRCIGLAKANYVIHKFHKEHVVVMRVSQKDHVQWILLAHSILRNLRLHTKVSKIPVVHTSDSMTATSRWVMSRQARGQPSPTLEKPDPAQTAGYCSGPEPLLRAPLSQVQPGLVWLWTGLTRQPTEPALGPAQLGSASELN